MVRGRTGRQCLHDTELCGLDPTVTRRLVLLGPTWMAWAAHRVDDVGTAPSVEADPGGPMTTAFTAYRKVWPRSPPMAAVATEQLHRAKAVTAADPATGDTRDGTAGWVGQSEIWVTYLVVSRTSLGAPWQVATERDHASEHTTICSRFQQLPRRSLERDAGAWATSPFPYAPILWAADLGVRPRRVRSGHGGAHIPELASPRWPGSSAEPISGCRA